MLYKILIEKLKMDTKHFLLHLYMHFNLMECIIVISNCHHVQVDILYTILTHDKFLNIEMTKLV